jgi:tetratricopeptide (TPR) repeat protein
MHATERATMLTIPHKHSIRRHFRLFCRFAIAGCLTLPAACGSTDQVSSSLPEAVISPSQIPSTAVVTAPTVPHIAETTPSKPTSHAVETASDDSLVQQGMALADQQQYQQAITVFDQVISQNPTNARAIYQRGRAYANLDEQNSLFAVTAGDLA